MDQHHREEVSSRIFRCERCGAAFLVTRNACCPPVFQGIANCGPLDEMRPRWQMRARSLGVPVDELVFDRDWIMRTFHATSIGKFLPDRKSPSANQAYVRCFQWSGIQHGVILDFGCCLAHGAELTKTWAPEAVYLGVDHEPLFLALASVLYRPDFLYLCRREEDRARPLRHIASRSIDLLISSCLTSYENCAAFLAEWLRVLKPGGLLHFETHTLSAFRDAQGRPREPYPDPEQRRLIAAWLERHFAVKTTEHSLGDFVRGHTRLAGQFQRLE